MSLLQTYYTNAPRTPWPFDKKPALITAPAPERPRHVLARRADYDLLKALHDLGGPRTAQEIADRMGVLRHAVLSRTGRLCRERLICRFGRHGQQRLPYQITSDGVAVVEKGRP